MEEMRLHKYLSSLGIMSRRAAEKEIESGKIKVNGNTAVPGTKIIPGKDRVTYRGKPVEAKEIKKVYVMLNKPRGYVTTLSDEKKRKCVTDLTKEIETRVYPIGRLDMDSEGLLLLTNDGDIANKLTHPKHEIPKIYHVKIQGELSKEDLERLGGPMKIDGYDILPVKCEVVTRKNDHTVVRMELYEGRNRQIRKMCEQVGLKIINLKRVAVGEIKLGNLSPGSWRYLSRAQVEYLKKI